MLCLWVYVLSIYFFYKMPLSFLSVAMSLCLDHPHPHPFNRCFFLWNPHKQLVGEWDGEWGKQVGSMNEESKVRCCYNITFICTHQENVGSPLNQMHRQQLKLLLTTCYCRDTGGKRMRWAQCTSFNTLDNWGHKTPTQSKRKKDKKEQVKGSHTIHSVTDW